MAQHFDFTGDIQAAQQIANAFGAHFGIEVITEFVQLSVIVVFSEQLAALQRGHAGVGNHKSFEIQHALDVAQSHIQHHAQA